GMADGLDTRRGRPEESAEVHQNIVNVTTHVPDPVNGGQGALGRFWQGARGRLWALPPAADGS
ncbi:MAG: hypothetical protein JOY66_08125, partial [Acetobacteraceae bacterium]|nr:hypothetical protein [Acetobacteraceae bacterium]